MKTFEIGSNLCGKERKNVAKSLFIGKQKIVLLTFFFIDGLCFFLMRINIFIIDFYTDKITGKL